jgi:inner membrane protein
MTALTHQLIALLAGFWLLTIYPASVGWVVGILAIIFLMIGALTPDLDQPAANIWRRMIGGRAVGKIFQTVSGGHRHLTHSLLGIAGIGYILWQGIHTLLQPQFFAPALYVWQAFMVGYIAHLAADTLTDHGVPWLWPLPFSLKIPPGQEELRVTTGSMVEILLVRLGVAICLLLLLSSHWEIMQKFFAG